MEPEISICLILSRGRGEGSALWRSSLVHTYDTTLKKLIDTEKRKHVKDKRKNKSLKSEDEKLRQL